MTLGVRAIVFDEKNNSIFLVKHTYVPGWQLPGGGVDSGETFGQALERNCVRKAISTSPIGPSFSPFTRMLMRHREIM